MPPSVNPLRQQVIDRIATKLGTITAGADYWYTPGQVTKKFVHWAEAQLLSADHPVYSVCNDSGGDLHLSGAQGVNSEFDEVFYLNVKGIIAAVEDTSTVLARALRDVRKAIDDDWVTQTTGALGTLDGVQRVEIVDGAETDNGYLSVENKGFFEQRIKVTLCGKYQDL